MRQYEAAEYMWELAQWAFRAYCYIMEMAPPIPDNWKELGPERVPQHLMLNATTTAFTEAAKQFNRERLPMRMIV